MVAVKLSVSLASRFGAIVLLLLGVSECVTHAHPAATARTPRYTPIALALVVQLKMKSEIRILTGSSLSISGFWKNSILTSLFTTQPIYLLYRDLAKFMQHSSDINFLTLYSQKMKMTMLKIHSSFSYIHIIIITTFDYKQASVQ